MISSMNLTVKSIVILMYDIDGHLCLSLTAMDALRNLLIKTLNIFMGRV